MPGLASTPADASDAIERVRRFNRFYTRLLGLLEEGLLHSEYSLTEVRVLYELAHRESLTASALCRELGLDAGYLSRLLKKFESRGLILRGASGSDARQALLTLTPVGRDAFAPLDHAARAQVADLIAPLSPAGVRRLVGAMSTIEQALAGDPYDPVPYILRPPHVGDIGWIVHRHGVLYAQEQGWDATFEALVGRIASDFVLQHDPSRERCWVAERRGEVVGSIFLVRESNAVAKLRLLYVEPSARGLGIGSRLTAECVGLAREKGYEKLVLWTNDVLVSARRIYQANGFRLVGEERHHSFGKDLVGQHWELSLRQSTRGEDVP